jgi:threonylcarbamoyladenosine tRNA methylthiotransferase MtaB
MPEATSSNAKTIVAGCWATGDKKAAEKIPGVAAVLTHHDDVAARLRELLAEWKIAENPDRIQPPVRPAGIPTGTLTGTHSLPLLNFRQTHHQRAFLKIQDGCDAHCTYCIIPSLRPGLWSKPVEDVLKEARRLVDAGHHELVLTGIFLGAYGYPTALRRRQEHQNDLGGRRPLARLIDALCNQVRGLHRLRLSSLEPGDLDRDLLDCLALHKQVVPHFHLPLQSGSVRILRRMNRQYSSDDFLAMIDRVGNAFDRPALTTDIIVGFPGETDAEFQETMDVANRARFIHIHAFPFSPRPGTAAARWQSDFVRGSIVGERIAQLTRLADGFSYEFRSMFLNQTVELLVERENPRDRAARPGIRHGRCERYFDVEFEGASSATGDLASVRIDRVTPAGTFGTLVGCGVES